jgi:carbon starvation protein CstA
MVTFLLSIAILITGYFIYGKATERLFGADDKIKTPVKRMADGVDYIEMPTWKILLIQLLNIAGLGPIFGAVMGAMYGPASYIWIVFGCIFMGAVHDYFSGMMSIRNDGKSITEIIGKYLGVEFKQIARVLTLFLLILVGAAFVNGPAGLLVALTENSMPLVWWIAIIFAYYLIATLLPIDKIIGRIYPLFAIVLLIMGFGIGGYMIFGDIELIELSRANLINFHTDPQHNILYPMLFIVISCGAISGFHATQSPMMARCLKKESHGRYVFYGAMVAEGIIAIIWATAAINFFGGPAQLNEILTQPGHGKAWAVNEICNTWLGKTGAILALLGVIAAPISTGDTAYRSARLIVADVFNINQKSIWKRILTALPVFVVGFILSRMKFDIIWQYLGLTNQLLAVIVLWTGANYLVIKKKNHFALSIPAVILTSIVATYFLVAPYKNGGIFLDTSVGYPLGAGIAISCFGIFLWRARRKNEKPEL